MGRPLKSGPRFSESPKILNLCTRRQAASGPREKFHQRMEGKMAPDTTAEANTLKTAIQGGQRDENRLTDLIFNARHPERAGQRLQPSDQALVKEWTDIL